MKKFDTKDKKKIIIIAVIATLLVAIIVLFATGTVEMLLAKWGILKVNQVEPESTFYEYIPKGDGDIMVLDDRLLIADQSGVSCYSLDGTWQWNKEINLKSPVFIPNGKDEAVLGDLGGYGVYGFNQDGIQWTYIFDQEIINVSESTADDKIIVIHGADNYLSAATLVDFSGEVKAVASRKFGEYYMMSASISDDGKQAAIAGITQDSGNVSSVIAFMNLSGYELFATETIEGEFLPVVSYVGGNNLFAAGGDSLRKIYKHNGSSGKNDTNDLLWNRDGGSQELVAASASGNDNFVTVSTVAGADAGMEASCTVSIYSASGALKESFTCEGGVNAAKLQGKIVVLYGENEVFAYNIYGQLIGKFDGVSQISDVEFISDKVLAVCGTSKIAKVDFD